MLRIVAAFVLMGLFFAAGPASAQLYNDSELVAAYKQMARNIELMVTEDIVRTVPRAQRPAAAAIKVQFVPRGSNPLAFWSYPRDATVHVPMESIRFIDDLSVTFAYFERRGCSSEYLHTYLWALLRDYQPLPPPLVAFSIDKNAALADRFVNDVSNKIFNSTILFILAHEVGHILAGHVGDLSGSASQLQEIAADSFALDHFASIGAPPVGVTIYFLASRWSDPIGAAAVSHTHPTSPERIAAVAERLAQQPKAFSFGEPDPERGARLVLRTADNLRSIAKESSREQMLTVLPHGLKRDFPLSRLPSACPK